MQTTGQRIGHIQMLAKQQAPGYAADDVCVWTVRNGRGN